jgi:hypothetical protein
LKAAAVQPRCHLHSDDTEDVGAEAAGGQPGVIFNSADDIEDNKGNVEATGM